MKKIFFALFLPLLAGMAFAAANDDFIEGAFYKRIDEGSLMSPRQAKRGIVATNTRHSEIYLLENNQLKTLVDTRGCGKYYTLNSEKTLIGFKSINDNMEQAPAILNIATGEVTLLEPYAFQCGQVSFANDGTICYTVGDYLYISRNGKKSRYNLGFYTNIATISPDGKSVAYSSFDGEPMLMELTTQAVTKISDALDMYNPQWSPDGEKVVYEQAKMELFVYDKAKKSFKFLSKGSEAQWTSDSKSLIFAKGEYENDEVFRFKGTSVVKMAADGTEKRTLIPVSKECPQSVGLLDNNRLAVPYSLGENRRLAAISLSNTKAGMEETLFSLPKKENFGKNHKTVKQIAINSKLKSTSVNQTKGGSIGMTSIPYINQVHDTPPSYAGCTGYGYVACAPSTACMLLGYYGKLSPHGVASRAYGKPWGDSQYSYYVGITYTSNTGYTFNAAANGNGCYATGGFGFMWNGGSPSNKMGAFYTYNGVLSAKYENSYAAMRRECDANRPYSWCITSAYSDGHLILVFRSDATCDWNGSGYSLVNGRVGSVVVNDPYGDSNVGYSWAGTDGRYSTYDMQGYNNGHVTMTMAWGVCVENAAPAPSDTEAPKIHRACIEGNGRDSFIGLAYVTDNKGVAKVEFPTWTSAGDQDDMKWHEASAGSWTVNGQTYNYRAQINRSEHKNEYGPYIMHVYANDAAGNRTGSSSVTNMPYTIDREDPKIHRTYTMPAAVNSYAVFIYATDNTKIRDVKFPTWTDKNGQDDISWHVGTNGKWIINGQEYNYRYVVNTGEHKNERGPYTTHAYAYDMTGNSTSAALPKFNFDETNEVRFDALQRNPWNISEDTGLDGGSGTFSYDYSDGHFTVNFKSGGGNPRIWMNRSNLKNVDIVWSFWAKVSSGSVTFSDCGYENGVKKSVTITNEWKRFSGKGRAGSNQYDALVFYGGSLPKDVTLSVRDYSVKVAGGDITESNNVGLVFAQKGKAMPSINPPTKEDYIFQGYFTEKNGQGTKYYNANGTSARNMDKSEAIMLYSHWTEITDPRIRVSTNNVNFNVEAGRTANQVINLKGYYLSTDKITLSLTGNTNVIGISANELPKAGGDVNVSFAPTEEGSYSATLTATSGSITQTIQIKATATKRVNPVNTNNLFSKIPYVILENESTQANDEGNQKLYDGGNTTHGEHISFLSYGKIKNYTDAVTKNGKNADRVIFKTNRTEIVMGLPGTSLSKIRFFGGLHESHDNKFQGYFVDVRYMSATDTQWQSVHNQKGTGRMWANDTVTFNEVQNVVRLKITLSNDNGKYIGLSGIGLYGGYGGNIVLNTAGSGIYDNPYLYWKAYDANNNLIGEDNGLVDAYNSFNANFDGIRNFWEQKHATYKTIRFVVRSEDVNLMSCDMIGNKKFDVASGEHIIFDNMANAPIGLAIGGLENNSFFEVKGDGKVTLGANLFAANTSAKHQWLSVSDGNNKQAQVELQGIMGELRASGHSIYVNGGCDLQIKRIVGLDKWGFYEGNVNGSNNLKTDKTFYNVILDPTGANLVKNGGFEDHSMWERSGSTPGVVGFDSRPRTGGKSMYIQGKAGSGEAMVVGKYSNNRAKLVNDHAYYVRVYGYQEQKTGKDVQFYFGLAEPNLGTIDLGPAKTWNLYSARVATHNPGGLKDDQQVRIDYDNNNVAGEMWFDDYLLVDLTAFANENGLNVSDLTKEVCDQLFSGVSNSNTTGETMLQVEDGKFLPTIEIPVREGYIFGGYYDGIYGKGTKYINADGTPSRVWDSKTAGVLYAKWIQAGDATLTLDLNGGEYDGETVISAQRGSIVTLQKPTREGFTFTGWSGTGEKWLTRAQAQYGNDQYVIDTKTNGDEFISQAPSYIFRDCSQETPVTFRNGYKNDVIHLGRRHMHTNAMTINIWGRMDDWNKFVQDNMRLVSCTESGGWNVVEVGNTDKVTFPVHNGAYIHIISDRTFASLNGSNDNWHMFTLVIDTDSRLAKGFIDGEFVGSVVDNGLTNYNNSNTILLGGESQFDRRTAGQVLSGQLKNFGITNRALSNEEVAYIFAHQNETRYYLDRDAELTANWTPVMFPITYMMEGNVLNANEKYQFADMTKWEKNSKFAACGTVVYDAASRKNTINITGGPNHEKLYKAVEVEPNQNYELTLTYSSNFAGDNDFHYSTNYLPLQVLSEMDADANMEKNELNSACRLRIYPGSDTQTLRFNSGNNSTVYLMLDFGHLKDDQAKTVEISNLSLQKLAAYNAQYGKMPIPEKEGYSFGGWFTSENCLLNELVTEDMFVTDTTARTLYAQWAVCRIGERSYGKLGMAITDYQEGDTIVMLNNTTENVILDKTVTLVGNSKTLTGDLELSAFSRLEIVDNFTVDGKCIVGGEGRNAEQKQAANVIGNLTVTNHVVFKFSINMNNPNDPTQFKHWISIPFDVNIKDITGTELLDMADNPIPFKNAWYYVWNIMDYDTEARDRGEADVFKPIIDKEITLHANEGKVLQFTPKEYGLLTVEFPSVEALIVMNQNDEAGKTYANVATGAAANNNWRLCGQPYFCNTLFANEENGVKAFAKVVGQDNHFEYFLATDNEQLKPYESYFVQYAGTFHFQNPAALAPATLEKPTYLLTLSKEADSRRLGIVLSATATGNYTLGGDLAPVERDHKMQFYTKSKGNDLVFTELATGTASVSLGYEVAEAGEFTIAFTENESMAADANLTLEDKATNTFTDLRNGTYTFTSQNGVFDDRFVLHFAKVSTNINISANGKIVVLATDNSLEIRNVEIGTEVSLFDAVGKLIGKQTANANTLTLENVASGFYMLQVGNTPIKVVIND